MTLMTFGLNNNSVVSSTHPGIKGQSAILDAGVSKLRKFADRRHAVPYQPANRSRITRVVEFEQVIPEEIYLWLDRMPEAIKQNFQFHGRERRGQNHQLLVQQFVLYQAGW